MKFIFKLFILSFFIIQCQDASQQGFQGGGGPRDEKGQDLNSEAVVPPSNISGAYLTCATEVEPNPAKPDGVIGCRLSDNQGKKVPLDMSNTVYAISPPKNLRGIKVTEEYAPNDKRYDKLFFFMGDQGQNPAAVRSAMNNSTIGVRTLDENGNEKEVVNQFARVEIPSSAILEQLTMDYSGLIIKQLEGLANGTKEPINNQPNSDFLPQIQ